MTEDDPADEGYRRGPGILRNPQDAVRIGKSIDLGVMDSVEPVKEIWNRISIA